MHNLFVCCGQLSLVVTEGGQDRIPLYPSAFVLFCCVIYAFTYEIDLFS